MSGRVRAGVDIGGTFTDLCLVDDTGIVAVGKTLTTPDEPALAVEELVRDTVADAGLRADDVGGIVHGTTLVTNTLIQRVGARTALLATAGFSDALEMAREHRYELYDLMIELPRPLVPRHLRFDVPERMYAGGTVARPLDVGHVERLAGELAAHGVEAVAVCFLHSFRNAAHEREAREAVLRAAPGMRVALSSEVAPQIREYERMSTTVANVYVQGIVERYLADLERRLAGVGVERPPHIMLSSGGVATVETAARFPIRMLESGPAGGALAAVAFGEHTGRHDLLAFDMGGTTAKLCIVADGEPLVSRDFEVDRLYRLRPGSGLPVTVPVVDMIEIGVGGGSVARTDALGLLRVGPESAGSAPGPACYGRGGRRPTVTDADLLLGYLDPEYFLGGRMALDVAAAERAVAEHVAEPMGISVVDAAWGIHQTVDEDMANAARVHAVERGQDASRLPLFTFGGAGPVHGAGVAKALGCPEVIAPPAAGVMSAVGFLTAPLAFEFARSAHSRLDELAADDVAKLLDEMRREGEELLGAAGVAADDVTTVCRADVRYEGQGSELTVDVPHPLTPWPTTLRERFDAVYRERYGSAVADVPVEVLTWRVVCSGPRPRVALGWHGGADATGPARKGSRRAYFGDGFVDTPVYDRYRLAPGARVDGPALVEERESTLVLPPGAVCTAMDDGSLRMVLPSADGEETR